MATFIVTYDAHFGRDYEALYKAMADFRGVRLAESVWGIDLDNTPKEVRDWMRGLLDDDDTIIVIQIKPRPSWATRKVAAEATAWLTENI